MDLTDDINATLKNTGPRKKGKKRIFIILLILIVAAAGAYFLLGPKGRPDDGMGVDPGITFKTSRPQSPIFT